MLLRTVIVIIMHRKILGHFFRCVLVGIIFLASVASCCGYPSFFVVFGPIQKKKNGNEPTAFFRTTILY